jgi:endonuclease/exonuclease/phosphatase family metal-dependent hydrolase
LPLESIEAIELPFSVQRRVAISAIVYDHSRAFRLRVLSVHLDTRAPLTRGFIFGAAAARNRQAKSFVDALKRYSDEGLSMVVGGDLNTFWGPFESSIDTISAVAPRLNCGSRTHATGFTLDHMFGQFSPAIRQVSCGRAADRFESDHYPLVLAAVPAAHSQKR